MAAELISLRDVHLTFGSTPLLVGAELSVRPGDGICLVGRNGSGKSTLLKIAAGLITPDSGEVFVHPRAHVAYLPQDADLSGHATVLDYVAAGLRADAGEHAAQAMLDTLGFSGTENPARLSGGEARKVAIARVLAAEPDVLLLDEPTNHLDITAIEWLESELKKVRAAIVLISHDRRFLERLSRATVWLDRGKAQRLEEGFAGFEAWRDALLEKEEDERHKLDRKIEREESWMHGGVTARRKRNVRRVANLHALRAERKSARSVQGNVQLTASEGTTSGRLVVEATGVSKSYGGPTIVDQLSMRVMRGDRVGIVGPNGAGKSTLLALLTGQLAPDSGTIRLGTNLQMVTLDQRRAELKPEWTLAQAITGGRGDQVIINGAPRHVVSYMKDFLFTAEQIRSPLKVLSGGERGRLMLARALAQPSNLLVLDEPTNDLDLETLDLLQEMLGDYPGTVLLVSHDRDFLDRVVTSVLASEGDGRWIEYAGGYSDMHAQRAAKERVSGPTRVAATVRESKTGSGSSAPQSQPQKSRKLTYRQTTQLTELPKTIARLEKEIEELQRRLADPGAFGRDPAAAHNATSKLAELQGELSSAEDAWLELEMLRSGTES